ncbi:MAG: hypothetical protein ABIJ15_05580 [bacterium]
MRNKILTAGVFFLIFSAGTVAGLNFEYKAAPRIVTPDGNNHNDIFYIFYNNPGEVHMSGKVFNLFGMKVGEFIDYYAVGDNSKVFPKDPDYDIATSTKTWEGRLSWAPGSTPSGIYIYQFEAGNEIYTGTVVVAR